jgi:8-oxo-dGTP pyrophosphatase MutT (NUDIX family)
MNDNIEIIQRIKEVVFPVDYHIKPDRKPETTSDTGTLFESQEYDLISSAVLLPLVLRGSVWKLIMTKRSNKLKKHAGQISLPGGKYDSRDKNLFNTALRETSEEIGVNTNNVNIFGSLQSHETITGFRIFPFLGIISPHDELIKNSDEVEEIFEVPLTFVLEKKKFSRHFMNIKNPNRKYLAIPYGSHYIWGATARILYNLSEKFFYR